MRVYRSTLAEVKKKKKRNRTIGGEVRGRTEKGEGGVGELVNRTRVGDVI